MDLRDVSYEHAKWIYLAQDRFSGSSCEHGTELSGSINDGAFLTR